MRSPRSLRYRALVVVVVVVAIPLVWIWTAGTNEGDAVERLRDDLTTAVDAATAHAADHGELERLTGEHDVWLRVLSGQQLAFDHDGSGRSQQLQAMARKSMWGPGGPPTLQHMDAELGPLLERAEVRTAHTAATVTYCGLVQNDLYMLCRAARVAPGGRVVYATQGSARLVRSLYDQRWQLATIGAVVLVVGALLALWIGARMVKPIENLRDQVRARLDGRSAAPIRLRRTDELGELADAFEALLSALEQRNSSNEAFAADLAHELKNPVAAVRAAAEAMTSDRRVEGNRRERLARVLTDSSLRMDAMVSRFLDLARAEAGLVDGHRVEVDVAELLNAIVDTVASDDRFAELDIAVDVPRVKVWAVAERLETAFRNLVGNAASFSSSRVKLSGHVRRSTLHLTVHDDGPGVPEQDLPKIFDRYFTTRGTGTGLGLALTKAIIEAHGGTISVRNDGGALFEVSLPLSMQPKA